MKFDPLQGESSEHRKVFDDALLILVEFGEKAFAHHVARQSIDDQHIIYRMLHVYRRNLIAYCKRKCRD